METRMMKEKLLTSQNHHKGGLKTLPFIIANEAFEKVASYGLLPNMILYLVQGYMMDVTTATNLLFMWSAATNFTPALAAFLSDSYFGRFSMIAFGSVATLLGMVLLWLTAIIPQARPPPCDQSSQSCESPTTFQLVFLYTSFILMSIGAGGVRSSSLAFGADQLDKRDKVDDETSLESFFSWYYVSAAGAALVALTCIVYIQDHFGWIVGFGVPVILMFFSALLFFLASPLYNKMKPHKSFFIVFVQVLVVSYKNRHFMVPSENTTGLYHYKLGSDLVVPSNKLRFLNKACISRYAQEDLTQNKAASDSWSTCTVDQVEELKALINVIPIWTAGIMLSVTVSQTSFPLLQAKSMDRHITADFEFPAGSFGMFIVITIIVWLFVSDRVILPLASKIKGTPAYLGVKQRMGIGLFISCMSMAVSAIVENVRRKIAVREGFADDPQAVVKMSAMWLVPQHCLSGLAEAFNAVGQNEFYYSKLPKSMSSIATSLFGVGMSVANLLASFIFNTVDNVTGEGSTESWVSGNINRSHYDYYYWILAGLSLVNFVYYLVCCKAYGPYEGDGIRIGDEEDNMRNT